ncbi:MAG TPA: hypothetical protein PLP17_09340, partial [Oligoflexia bacterium]|nr:hypothetical protein [Oligoflexia bacterium]
MKDRELTTQRIFWLWLPLAATWLLMAVENPLIQAFISRMPDVRENLTAFGAALPIVLLIEAPILSIISASNTLVRDRDSYFGMRRFVFIASGVLCLVMLLLVLPGPYAYISREMLRLNAQTADLCWVVVLCFVPAPFTVAYRRMIQGILIHGGLTRKVGMATLVRLAAVGIVLGAAAAGRIAGAIAGA